MIEVDTSNSLVELDLPDNLQKQLRIRDQATYELWKERISLLAIDFPVFFYQIILPALQNGVSLQDIFGNSLTNCSAGINRSVTGGILLEAAGVTVVNPEVTGSHGLSAYDAANIANEVQSSPELENHGVVYNGVLIHAFFSFLELPVDRDPEFISKLSEAKHDKNTGSITSLESLITKVPLDVWRRLAKNDINGNGVRAIIVNTSFTVLKKTMNDNMGELQKYLSADQLLSLQKAISKAAI